MIAPALHRSRAFRFDAGRHEYVLADTGEVLPHITGLLKAGGLVDDRWFTEESCERGTEVHRLTAEYDLGAGKGAATQSPFRGYLQGYVEAITRLAPDEFLAIEEPMVHPSLLFGGRPDRAVILRKRHAILEVKTGAKCLRAHGAQTALQALLAADRWQVPASAWRRLAVYLRPRGQYSLEEHLDARDFSRAYGLIEDHGVRLSSTGATT